jgi:beta-lactamase regulating signal transducer with metallopeptidase domain
MTFALDWLLGASWQAGLLAAVALAAERALGRRLAPELRHALWLAVAARLLLPPFAASPVGVAPAAPVDPPAASWPLALWLGGVALGACVALARARRARTALLRGAAALPAAWARAAARAADALGLERPVRILVGDHGPAVFGVFRPTVVLPRQLPRVLGAEALEHVLLHELAHVRRLDLLAQWVFGALNVVYWFHPLVWVARRRAYAARELACDATVAAALAGPQAYRRTLARAALLLPSPAAAGSALLRGRSLVLARVRALDAWRPGRWRRPLALGAALLLVAAAAPAPRAVGEAALLRAKLAHGLANHEAYGCAELRHMLCRAVALEKADRP